MYISLGDSGYPNEPFCITPYRNAAENSHEAIFNEIHSKARSDVERTIGIYKGRFRILLSERQCRYTTEKTATISNVCAALHNICIYYNIIFNDIFVENTALDEDYMEVTNSHLSQRASQIRDMLKMNLVRTRLQINN